MSAPYPGDNSRIARFRFADARFPAIPRLLNSREVPHTQPAAASVARNREHPAPARRAHCENEVMPHFMRGGRGISALLGRAVETGALEGVLAAVRDGLSGVLVLRGEAGVGKTALLDWAAGQADEMQVARVAGAEAEMDMGFAGLHQLLIPFLGGFEGLPGPQRQALGSAFGLVDGPPPDRFLVGMAALTVLTDAAAARPVLCLIDDAQWLNQVSIEVLGFVARRLYADRVGMVFAAREGEGRAVVLAGLPELIVGGLEEEAAQELLVTSAGGQVDRQVSGRIVADTAGNPLALVELAAELTGAELSGAEPLDWPLRFEGRWRATDPGRGRCPAAQTLLLRRRPTRPGSLRDLNAPEPGDRS